MKMAIYMMMVLSLLVGKISLWPHTRAPILYTAASIKRNWQFIWRCLSLSLSISLFVRLVCGHTQEEQCSIQRQAIFIPSYLYQNIFFISVYLYLSLCLSQIELSCLLLCLWCSRRKGEERGIWNSEALSLSVSLSISLSLSNRTLLSTTEPLM